MNRSSYSSCSSALHGGGCHRSQIARSHLRPLRAYVAIKDSLHLGLVRARKETQFLFPGLSFPAPFAADPVLEKQGSQRTGILLVGNDDKRLLAWLNFEVIFLFFFWILIFELYLDLRFDFVIYLELIICNLLLWICNLLELRICNLLELRICNLFET